MTTTQKPTIGRLVHYQPLENDPRVTCERTGQPWAATITEIVDGDAVRLELHRPFGQDEEPIEEFWPGVYDRAETPAPGHWNWPPRS